MAYSRRYSKRRYMRKKTRSMKRISFKRMIHKVPNQVHRFKRTATLLDLVAIPLGGYHASFQFSLDQLPNYNEFVNLYDSYKIKCVVLRIEPAFTENPAVSPLLISNKYLRVVHDYDDAATLTTESEYFEYSNCKSYASNRLSKIVVFPKVSAEVYRSPIASGYEQRKSPWLDLSSSGASIPHYGVKVFFPYLGITESFQFRVVATFYVHMRQSK